DPRALGCRREHDGVATQADALRGGTSESRPLARVLLLTTMEVRSMPEKETLERAQEDAAEGKSPSTQAGEFVREEMHHIREGKHGARSTKQAIAIGLSKARRAGVELSPPKEGQASKKTRKQAARDLRKGKSATKAAKSSKRSRATSRALKREGHSAASKTALSRHAHSVAAKRSPAARSRSAKKAGATRKK